MILTMQYFCQSLWIWTFCFYMDNKVYYNNNDLHSICQIYEWLLLDFIISILVIMLLGFTQLDFCCQIYIFIYSYKNSEYKLNLKKMNKKEKKMLNAVLVYVGSVLVITIGSALLMPSNESFPIFPIIVFWEIMYLILLSFLTSESRLYAVKVMFALTWLFLFLVFIGDDSAYHGAIHQYEKDQQFLERNILTILFYTGVISATRVLIDLYVLGNIKNLKKLIV